MKKYITKPIKYEIQILNPESINLIPNNELEYFYDWIYELPIKYGIGKHHEYYDCDNDNSIDFDINIKKI